jgi:kynurenine formamidase
MKEMWGKWGADDEAGALNRISDDCVRNAVRLVRSGIVMGLAQPISSSTPVPEPRPRVAHFMGRDGGDYLAGKRRAGGFQFSDDTIVMPMHVGTHLDALCHCWYDDTLYNGFSATEVRSNGARRLGIEKAGPIVTRGVLLDFVAINGSPLDDGSSIGVDMVREAVRRSETELRNGDAVLLRTGWQERVASGAPVCFDSEPGIDVEAALHMAHAGAALVGADNFAVEVLPFPKNEAFPVHKRLIRDFGIPLLEGLVLEPLAKTGAREFLFIAAPLPITGATSSPINPVAIL